MEKFGTYNNKNCYLYTVENENYILKVTDYGATLVSFINKHNQKDIIFGFDDVSGYINDVPYMGASIGRVCNRISKGSFNLNGINYQLAINNGPNSLHGGIIGFDKVIWDIKVVEDKIICSYLSKDMEEGYPGNLNVKVTYTLLNNGFRYEYEGISDKDTLFSMTNHAFFNLNGLLSQTILDHELEIDAEYIAKVDQDGQTLDELLAVENTPFDFRKRKAIGKEILSNHSALKNGNGYDHHFLVKGEGYRKMLTCYSDDTTISVYSDLPGFHLYSGNFLDGNARGKADNNYPKRSAVCFETQYYPDAVNCKHQLKPVLKANVLKKHRTDFIFE